MYGQQFCNHDIQLETHNTDPSAIKRIVMKQMIKFLQSRGVCDISENYLRKYLTGDPVWFVTEQSSVRVPIVGIHTQSRGFETPPCEVPESLLSHVIQQQSSRLTNWIRSLSSSSLDRVLRRVAQVALRRELPLNDTLKWKQIGPHIYASQMYNLKIDVRVLFENFNHFHILILRQYFESHSASLTLIRQEHHSGSL